jgi:peptidoglycan/LPS O-acetylase OafA/YrhL
LLASRRFEGISTLKYRKEIDGLRAIAVLPVILFHAGFEKFSGGFVGVDVFFVISGYLITTIILTEKEQGIFSLVNFYERRFRRIIPALFTVMAVSLIFSWFWLSPSHMKDFSQSLIAVSTFSSNILFWQETGYWGTENELKPLLHTWSLAVEEQYYILFPLLLMFMWRFNKHGILVSFLVITIVSLSFSHWAAFNNPAANFFLLTTRAWELTIGAVIAFYFLYQEPVMKSLVSHRLMEEIFGWMGLLLIACSVFIFDESTPFPSLYALAPTIGTALIILFSSKETSLGKVLGSRVLVGIGLVSYSVYLWHQPLFAFARHIHLDKPSPVIFLLLSLISFILAYFSWKYVETPFKNRAGLSRKQIFSFAAIGSLFFIIFGLLGYYTKGFPERYPIEFRDIASLTSNKANSDRNLLRTKICKAKTDDIICGKISHDSINILITGDSHGPDGLNVFAKAFPTANFLVAHKAGCPLIHDLTGIPLGYQQCESYNRMRFSAIEKISKNIDLAVLSQRMTYHRLEGTKKTIHWMNDNRLSFAVLGAGPWYKYALPSLILRYKSLEGLDEKLSAFAITKHYGIDDEIEPLVKSLGGYYIRKQDFFCPKGICRNILPDGNPISFDDNHLTLSAAIFFGDTISDNHPLLLKQLTKNN